MKLPESFYCKHTCTLTAYWVESPLKYFPWAAMHLAQWCYHCLKSFWNSCCGIAFSAASYFFWDFQCPEIFIPLRQALLLETARSHVEQNQRNGSMFHYSNWFLGQKLLDRECLVGCNIVMVENPITGPKFRPFSTYSFMWPLHYFHIISLADCLALWN
jgi:hypothetical protein